MKRMMTIIGTRPEIICLTVVIKKCGIYFAQLLIHIGHPFPAICVRAGTEEPETLDKGNFILAGITTEQML